MQEYTTYPIDLQNSNVYRWLPRINQVQPNSVKLNVYEIFQGTRIPDKQKGTQLEFYFAAAARSEIPKKSFTDLPYRKQALQIEGFDEQQIYRQIVSNSVIREAMSIAGYALYELSDFKAGVSKLQKFENARMFMIELYRLKEDLEPYESSDIPLAYALFGVNNIRTIDACFLLGVWTSGYGRIRYAKNGKRFPRGLGLSLIRFGVEWINRNVQPFRYVGLEALDYTRRALMKPYLDFKPINVYRYWQTMRWPKLTREQYDAEERYISTYYSKYNDDIDAQPSRQSVGIAEALGDIHFLIVDELLADPDGQARMVTVASCVNCAKKATLKCQKCRQVYCSDMVCQSLSGCKTNS